MASEILLPRLGQGMESGVIVRWLKAEGDTVAKGEQAGEQVRRQEQSGVTGHRAVRRQAQRAR